MRIFFKLTSRNYSNLARVQKWCSGTYLCKNRLNFTSIFQGYSLFSKSHFECVSIDDIANQFNLHVSNDEYLENKTRDQEFECVFMVYFQMIFEIKK